MRIHRSAQSGESTAIANEILQNGDLSYAARGVLTYLLSLPDGSLENSKNLAAIGIEGRTTIKKAVAELRAAGYYQLVTKRLPAGRVISEIHVYDTPQLPQDTAEPGTDAPGAGIPGPGAASVGAPGGYLQKKVKETTTPLPSPAPSDRREPGGADEADRPTEPVEPVEPDALDEPGEPDLPGQPDEPDLPYWAYLANWPTWPTWPTWPNRTHPPADPSEPSGTTDPGQPDGPDQPDLPDQPHAPCEPYEPNAPADQAGQPEPDDRSRPAVPPQQAAPPAGPDDRSRPAVPPQQAAPLAGPDERSRPAAPPAEQAEPPQRAERAKRAIPAQRAAPAGRAQRAERAPRTPRGTARAALTAMDGRTREAVAALFRALRNEPRLRLGEAEARRLAPLVVPWLERNVPEADLVRALTSYLPPEVTSPAGLVRFRLKDKLPPVPEPAPPAKPPQAECAKCCDPIPQPGICPPCAGLGARREPAVGGGAAFARAGAARVREAMQWVARPGRSAVGNPVPAG
ncbi:hypothetical protein ACFYS8_11935 [Kitasatospora sp. NPDC004615]|uniref:hypothetical protein n=1 Tax=Kitasatospora sp. NPDC004615 TaxID=3364017 RepID=UPI0036A1039C